MGDFGLTTFAKKGALPQVENAATAASKGETCLGIKA